MSAIEVDHVLLSIGADLPYFSGYEAMTSERMTMLVVPSDDEPTMFVPSLEASRVGDGPFEMLAWTETQEPLALVADRLNSSGRVAVGDHMWSSFLVDLQARAPGNEWLAASVLTRDIRMRKEPAEIENLRRAGAQADAVADRIPSEVRFAGSTEVQIARRVSEMLIEEGHDTAEFAIVASGPNGASPHHGASGRKVDTGDIVVIDFGGRVSGYFSDTSRTFSVGTPEPLATEVHRVVADAQKTARAAARPGVTCEAVDRAARSVIVDAGYGEYFVHRTGHGIGLEVHEHPYLVEGNEQELETGMAFSIEPGIYIPGRLGVRIEDIAVVTTEGIDALNSSPRALVEVE